MIYYLATRAHCGSLHRFLQGDGKALASRMRAIPYEDLFRQRRIPVGTYLFTDLERMDRQALERAAVYWEALAGCGRGLRQLNHPLRVKRRYELLRALHDQGLNDFDVLRADEGRVPRRFPVFIRVETDHRGPETGLIHTPEELAAAIQKLPARGRSRDQRIVTEYCAEADAEGRFRKYAAFLLSGRIVPRHLLVSRSWAVKGRDRESCNETIPEQIDYTETNPHAAELRRVFEVAQIDYGRCDYTVVGGRVQVYEINTNPQITVPDTGQGNPQRKVIRRRFAARALEFFRSLDYEGAAETIEVSAVGEPRGPWATARRLLGRGAR